MEDKKLKNWRKLFKDSLENQTSVKRVQEIDVLLAELASLQKGAQIYKGSEKTVFFVSDLAQTKADLKKEKNSLKKRSEVSSNELAF